MIVNPGATGFDGENPGYTLLKINTTSQIAYDLQFKFLSIEKTYNWTKPYPEIKNWPWNELNFTTEVGLNEVTSYGIE